MKKNDHSDLLAEDKPKKRVLITIDPELRKRIKKMGYPLSTLIQRLLWDFVKEQERGII